MDSSLRMSASLVSCLPKARSLAFCWFATVGLLVVLTTETTAQRSPQFRSPQQHRPARFRTVNPRESNVRQVNYESSRTTDVIKQGEQFELRQQWAEALNLYQQALKSDPNNSALRERRSIARIHFDLDRRYSDTSFIDTISTTSGAKALDVYAEVLLKIQSYYVDQPNWSQLANYGLSSLEIALRKPEFLKRNLRDVPASTVRSAFESTVAAVKSSRSASRQDIYAIAHSTARLMEQKIGLPRQATVYEFICGAISALDPYSAFMSGNQYSETMSQIEGNFVGLGVELRTHPNSLEIVNVIPGGSAHRGGLATGDHITAVENLAVNEVGSERAADMLRGTEGSFVRVSIRRDDQINSLSLQRRRVDIPSVDQVKIVDKEYGIGYIRLTNFQKTSAKDFDQALWKLHRAGMRSLIVDVRGNPGGLLSASVEIADRFVDAGVIVSTRGRNPMEDYTHQAQASNTWRMPLVVLIDENSASASEIFAAAIRDHHRGTIVGKQSYGKGSVQGIFPLNVSGGGVRLTTAKFYSPLGRAISQVGVAADVEIHEAAKPTSQGVTANNDNGLRVGIQVARRTLALKAKTQRSFAGR